MDILGTLQKLIEITFRSGTHDATIKGGDGDNVLTKNIEVQIKDGPEIQTMTTDNNTQTLTNKTIDSVDNTITLDADNTNTTIINIDNDEIKDLAGIDATKIHDGSVTNVEFGHISTVASNVQDQINNVQDQIDADVLALSNHLADTVDSHDASSISYVNTASTLDATEVQEAINEIVDRVDAAESDISSNDTDILNLQTDKADNIITITGVGELTGGGNLTANREINVGPNVNLLDAKQIVTGEKTLNVTNLGIGTAINNNASPTLEKPDKTIISLTGIPIVTDIETLTATDVENGRIALLRNDTEATFVIKSTGNIATTDNIELEPEAIIMLCYDNGAWDVVGSQFFSPWSTSVVSASFTAANYNEIITDGTAGITITLPDSTKAGTRIRIVDGGGENNWSVNNVIVSGINGAKINFSTDPLILDVGGTWVELISDGTDWLVLTA